ncbi:hypothetical protein F5Y17DRAFT_223442 [Xylariaceae sp. FL0594]|nr:hypothetical protein F5Y17DRAFT_223442 [Xylariaceae sp. FL0594]
MASPEAAVLSTPPAPSLPASRSLPVSLSPSPPPPHLPSDEKVPLSVNHNAPSAFERLPDEIIEHILQLTDPDSFASLVLLNAKWRRISQQAYLYAYHLSRCPSYAASHTSIPPSMIEEGNLPNLRRLFAREVKRNLFEAYLRPKITTVKLISNSISSSSAPGGEGMQFSPSPRGHHLLAYNSSRIYVLDLRGHELVVARELKILRRPVSTCIVDDGSFLAVLSTDMQVDLYDLTQSPPRRTQSLILDNTPRAIALSPCGKILAAAYEGGIEVSTVNPGAHPTERRAVKCDAVDALAFSLDGTQLLGTTTASTTPNTVILTAPYYDPGNQLVNDDISALWTTSILFPNTSRDCSHGVLLQESSSMEAMWTFAYDRSFETFRAVRIEDLRNGTTYFTGPVPTNASPSPLVPSTLPAANYQGELVSAGFEGKHIWLYGVPEDLEAVPEVHHPTESSALPTLRRRASGLSVRSPSRVQEPNGARVPQWQILCDKFRNTFVAGRKIAESSGVSSVKWVSGYGESSLQERLVISAKGIVPHRAITEEEGIDFVDGGRITVLDFDYAITNGQEHEIVIEVGTAKPEALEEEHRDMATEVAIVRRRTVAQRRGNRSGVMRAATTIDRQAESLLRTPGLEDDAEDPLIPRRMRTAQDTTRRPDPDVSDDASMDEAQEALDAPYTHASPRSGTTLRRAATAAAVSRQRNPPPPAAGRVEYRRADGRTEHPHESDADNWVPPPPPYSKEDPVVDLPAFLRNTTIPRVENATERRTFLPDVPPVPPLPSFALPQRRPLSQAIPSAPARPQLPRIRTSGYGEHPWPTSSNVTRQGSQTVSGSSESIQRGDQPQQSAIEDSIYDASPLGTPSLAGCSPPGAQSLVAITPEPERSAAEAQAESIGHIPLTMSGRGGPDLARLQNAMHDTPTSVGHRPSTMQSEGLRHQAGDETPDIRWLSNASTWPRMPNAPVPTPGPELSGHPRSAPAVNMNHKEPQTAAPTPARSEQSQGIHSRQSTHGLPRPASSGFQWAQAPSRGALDYHQRFSVQPPRRRPSPDQPLIISTPTGVTGAFDTPHASSSEVLNPPNPILHAPVPRHPRRAPGDFLYQPTVERLETMTSLANRHEARPDSTRPSAPATLSSQLFFRHRTSVHRRPSRARRGALKNLQDARERGWTGRKKKKPKETDADHSGGWTDVVASSDASPTHTKAKKCAIM